LGEQLPGEWRGDVSIIFTQQRNGSMAERINGAYGGDRILFGGTMRFDYGYFGGVNRDGDWVA